MYARSNHWVSALASWKCPTDASGDCDPCGNGPVGIWEHMHCRGLTPGTVWLSLLHCRTIPHNPDGSYQNKC